VLYAAQEDEEKSFKMGNHLMAPRETSPREKRETNNELWLKNCACRESTKVASLAKREKEN